LNIVRQFASGRPAGVPSLRRDESTFFARGGHEICTHRPDAPFETAAQRVACGASGGQRAAPFGIPSWASPVQCNGRAWIGCQAIVRQSQEPPEPAGWPGRRTLPRSLLALCHYPI